MPKTCIVNGIVVTMNRKQDILDGGTVVIEGDRISAVLAKGAWHRDGNEELIDAQGMIVMPGLINTHMHSRPFRALGDGLPTSEWHSRYAHTLSSLMNEENTYLGALCAFAENIKGGITCAANMPPSVAGSDKAAWEIGIRAFLFPHGGSDALLKDSNETLEKSVANVEKAGDQAGKRVQIWFGFGHPYECDQRYFRKMKDYAMKYKTGISGHVAASRRELALNKEIYGKPIVDYFYETGFLGEQVLLAHGVHLTPREVELMVETKTTLTHCPSSVMRVGHQVTPVLEMKQANLTIGLGTDGPLSTYRMDMFEIMRLACFLQRVRKNDGSVFPAMDALKMATIDGAKTLGLQNEIGSLEAGKKADVLLVDFQKPNLAPLALGKHSNIVALLVFSCSASDVDTVIIDGKVVMRNRELLTVNEKEIISKINEVANRVLSQIE